LVNTLLAATEGIDGNALAALAQDGQPNEEGFSSDPRYAAHLDWLDEIHRIEPRAWPYSYIQGDDPLEVVFVGDLWARYDAARAGGFLEEYVSEGPMYQGLTELTIDTNPYTDPWGNWISAWAPVKNSSGEIVGGLGVDFRADYVFQVQQSIRNRVVIAFAVTYSALFALVYLVSRAFTRPIILLTQAAERIGEGDYDQDLSGLTRKFLPDEIGTLANVFSIMIGKVYQREQTLRRQVEELRIMVDEGKKKQQVREIVDSDFFRDLQERAREMRHRARPEVKQQSGGEKG
jgi:methyl-accepting chemotaxis protein